MIQGRSVISKFPAVAGKIPTHVPGEWRGQANAPGRFWTVQGSRYLSPAQHPRTRSGVSGRSEAMFDVNRSGQLQTSGDGYMKAAPEVLR